VRPRTMNHGGAHAFPTYRSFRDRVLDIGARPGLHAALPPRFAHRTSHRQHARGPHITRHAAVLTEQDVLLVRDGQVTRTPLDSVGRIVTPPDPVWDGAAKGAAIPLILYAVFCHGCEGGGEFILRSTLAYSAIGLAIDALDTNRKTLYKGSGRSASVTWRIGF
jgi:hypothetical protein